jgi:hypothetical protein
VLEQSGGYNSLVRVALASNSSRRTEHWEAGPGGLLVNDIQRAGRHDVFVQPDDGRFVVRGPKGREHIIEVDGEHVTSVRRPDTAHHARLRDGTIRSASDIEFQKLKAFIQ